MEKTTRNPFISLVSVILMSMFLATVSASSSESRPAHFVLVHGGCLGAWSWYKLIPLLKSHGHDVTAIDLAASGINLFPLNDIRSLTDYNKPLMDYMASIPANEKVILVAHSFGGGAVSQAMELFPHKISAAVFVTAAMPGPSLSFSLILQRGLANVTTALDNKLIFDNGPNNPPTSFIFGPNYLSQVLYERSPPEDAALASMLVRPLRLVTGDEMVFTEGRYGSVKRIYIQAENDEAFTKDLQEWMVGQNPPHKVLKIAGSDHMVMASQPTQLAARLANVAKDL